MLASRGMRVWWCLRVLLRVQTWLRWVKGSNSWHMRSVSLFCAEWVPSLHVCRLVTEERCCRFVLILPGVLLILWYLHVLFDRSGSHTNGESLPGGGHSWPKRFWGYETRERAWNRGIGATWAQRSQIGDGLRLSPFVPRTPRRSAEVCRCRERVCPVVGFATWFLAVFCRGARAREFFTRVLGLVIVLGSVVSWSLMVWWNLGAGTVRVTGTDYEPSTDMRHKSRVKRQEESSWY